MMGCALGAKKLRSLLVCTGDGAACDEIWMTREKQYHTCTRSNSGSEQKKQRQYQQQRQGMALNHIPSPEDHYYDYYHHHHPSPALLPAVVSPPPSTSRCQGS